jgi:diaminopimelate decarboxylase
MTLKKYERPFIVKNPVGLMHKIGRRKAPTSEQNIDGVSVEQLRQRYGSPLFVFSERRIRSRVREAKAALAAHVPGGQLCWSYKTRRAALPKW